MEEAQYLEVTCNIRCFMPMPAALGRVRVLLFCVVCPRRGPALRLEVCLLEFPAVVCALTPIPTVASLCNIRYHLQVAKKARGALERDRSNTTCSVLTSLQRLRNVQHLHNQRRHTRKTAPGDTLLG